MRDWAKALESEGVLVADGAWGTELAARGLPAGTAPEAWNREAPEKVRAVAEAYVNAGAQIILTNTFGGNRFKLAKSGLADELAEINRRGAALSREAAGESVFVFASMGPSGEFLEPLGEVTEEEMAAAYAEQAAALAAGGADAILIETMSDLGEALAALRGTREATKLPVAVSLTYEKGQRGYATMMGVRPRQAVAALEEAGADLAGANCGAGVTEMIEVVKEMRGATALPLWAKANAGLPELVEGRTVFRETPSSMAEAFPRLFEAGARVAGGCCGTGPEHIRLCAQAAEAWRTQGSR